MFLLNFVPLVANTNTSLLMISIHDDEFNQGEDK